MFAVEKGGESLQFVCSDEAEKQRWVKQLKELVKGFLKKALGAT